MDFFGGGGVLLNKTGNVRLSYEKYWRLWALLEKIRKLWAFTTENWKFRGILLLKLGNFPDRVGQPFPGEAMASLPPPGDIPGLISCIYSNVRRNQIVYGAEALLKPLGRIFGYISPQCK